MTETTFPVKVSVVTLAYNQERYIRQALDSILAQECDFTYECIIGDDCSTDATPEILREYAERFPDRINPVLRTTNLGARHNLADLLARCRGQYVAILDGDDYWTSPHKLQRQVEFMDAHPDCALSFHDVRAIDRDGNDCDIPVALDSPARSEIEDLLRENFISTCTVMYRWGLIGTPPGWFFETWISDYSLHVLHASHGWIGHIDEVMAAYRVHDAGMWSGEHAAVRADEFVKTLSFLDAEFDYRYHSEIEDSIRRHAYHEYADRFREASELFSRGLSRQARRHVPWLLLHSSWRDDIRLGAVVVLVVRSVAPWLVQPLVGLKQWSRGLLRPGSGDRR